MITIKYLKLFQCKEQWSLSTCYPRKHQIRLGDGNLPDHLVDEVANWVAAQTGHPWDAVLVVTGLNSRNYEIGIRYHHRRPYLRLPDRSVAC